MITVLHALMFCCPVIFELNPGPDSTSLQPPESPVFIARNSGSNITPCLYLQNVRSLKNKPDVFHSTLITSLQPVGKFSFFALTETWLKNDILDPEINIPGYTIFRNDRCHKRGGGVLLGCSNAYVCQRKFEFEEDNLELLWVEIRFRRQNKLLLGVFYRPPDGGVQSLEALADSLTNASGHYNSICLVGDFNLPSLKWTMNNGHPISSGSAVGDMFPSKSLPNQGQQHFRLGVVFRSPRGNFKSE